MVLLERRDTLKTLHFDGSSLRDQGYQHLSVCKSLEELQIRNAWNIGDNGLESISRLKNLKVLELHDSYTSTKETGFVNLFSDKKLENLEKLVLLRCDTSTEVVNIISQNCLNLTSLKIENCGAGI